jgi:hypothetical protein
MSELLPSIGVEVVDFWMRNDVQIPWPGVPDLLDAYYRQYYGVTNPVAALSHVCTCYESCSFLLGANHFN